MTVVANAAERAVREAIQESVDLVTVR